MDNMRRMLPAPTLRMSEGGMFSGLKRAVGMGPKESLREKYAREDAALKAKTATAPAPAAAPAPAPAISGYVGNSALEGRMKAAGLRDGGDLRTGMGGKVPGSGSGDKIPAKYEPGEFVVSNDMLDAAPELREQLGGLREQVLAQKGMTPEQADAKALKGTGLRAQSGYTPNFTIPENGNQRPPVMQAQPRLGYAPGTAVVPSTQPNFTIPEGVKQARPVNTAGMMSAADRVQDARTIGGAEKTMRAAGQITGKAMAVGGSRFVPGGAAIGSMVEDSDRVNSVLNDPNATGIDKTAAVSGGIGKAAATGLGAVGGAKAGALLGGALGSVIPGPGTVIGATVGGIGGSILGAYGANRAAGALVGQGDEATLPAPAAPTSSLRNPNQTAQVRQRTGAMLNGGDAGRGFVNPTLDGFMEEQDMRDPSGMTNAQIAARNPAGRVTKTVGADGRTSYSGGTVTGEVSFQDKSGNTLRGQPGGGYMSVGGGMPQAEIDATLNNPDGSRWSAGDNAIMAANLRDGVDPYRGTSRAPKQEGNKYSGLPIDTARALRVADANNAAENRRSSDKNAITLRGQDNDMRIAMAPAQLAAQQRQMRAQIFEQAGGDLRKASDLMLKYGMDPKDLTSLETSRVGIESTTQATGIKAKDQLDKEFTQFTPDGKEDGAATQQVTNMVRQMFPGIDQMAEGPRNAAMSDAKEMAGIFSKARSNDRVGWDAAKFWKTPNPTLNNMPSAKGAATEQVGPISGLFTIGASNGDTLMRRPDGTELNLGRLNSRQLELLQRAQKDGWGK